MLKIENGYKYYFKGKNNEIIALNNINLEFINKGLVLINGTSGSGKSTLLNIISGNEQLDEGSIYPDLNNRLSSFIFQDFKLIEYLSVYDNLKLILDLKKDKDYNKIEKVLNELELINYKDSKVNELSGGQKQRVAIARAILLDYKIILCDEPTGNLDKNNKINIVKILKELSKDKLIIVVSHDIDIWDTYYDQLIKIDDGIIIENKIINESKSELKYTNNFNLSLTYKIAFEFFKKIKYKLKGKLIFNIILFSLSIAIFMLANMIYFNNSTKAMYKIIKNSDAVLTMKKFVSNNPYDLKSLSLEEVNKYQEKYNAKQYYNDIGYIDITYNDLIKKVDIQRILINNDLNLNELLISNSINDLFESNMKNLKINNVTYTIIGSYENSLQKYIKESRRDYQEYDLMMSDITFKKFDEDFSIHKDRTGIYLIDYNYKTYKDLLSDNLSHDFYLSEYDYLSTDTHKLTSYFLYVLGIIFFILVNIFIMNYINYSIKTKGKDIGLLKFLNIKNKDINKIFRVEMMYIYIISILIAVAIEILLQMAYDNYYSSKYSTFYHFINYDPLIYFGSMLIIYLIIELFIFIGLKKINNSKNIDIMNERI